MGELSAFPAIRSIDNRFDEKEATTSPVESLKQALDVAARVFVILIATDAVEVGSTSTDIMATAHSAIRGDIVRFTSGPFINREAVVEQVGAARITLADELPSAPNVGDTFEILRYQRPTITGTGYLPTAPQPNVLLVYDTLSALGDNVLATIATYTAAATTVVSNITAGGELYAEYTLVLNTVDIAKKRSGPDRWIDFGNINLSLGIGDVLDLKVIHYYNAKTSNFESSFFGF